MADKKRKAKKHEYKVTVQNGYSMKMECGDELCVRREGPELCISAPGNHTHWISMDAVPGLIEMLTKAAE